MTASQGDAAKLASLFIMTLHATVSSIGVDKIACVHFAPLAQYTTAETVFQRVYSTDRSSHI